MHHIIIAIVLIVVGVILLGMGQMINSLKGQTKQKWEMDVYNKVNKYATPLMVLGGIVILCGVALIAIEFSEEDHKADLTKPIIKSSTTPAPQSSGTEGPHFMFF
uniref:Uncharacterized protein n=1 Tax=viral metagenome TaxID=1070528 RepID=A0A6C0KRG2_9ZZZZ